MPTSLKDRVEAIELKVEELAAVVQAGSKSTDWRRTFGASADDKGFDEMIRLGKAARRAAKDR